MIPIPKTMVKIVDDFLQLSQGSELYVFERGEPGRDVDIETETEIQLYEANGDTVVQPVSSNGSGKFPYYVQAAGKYDLYSPDDVIDALEPWEALDADIDAEILTLVNESAADTLELANAYTDEAPETIPIASATYTLQPGDELNVIIEATSASLQEIEIPAGQFGTNAQIAIDVIGAGGIEITAGGGVTIQSFGGFVNVDQYGSVIIRHRGANTYFLSGDLVAP